MKSTIGALFILLAVIFTRNSHAKGICSQSFQRHLDCMQPSVYDRVTKFADEIKIEVKNDVEACFAHLNCPKPFTKDTELHEIIDQPKAAKTIKMVLDVLENSPKDVQACTLKYLVDFAGKKVEKCIQTVNAGGSARFKMPKLPSFDIFTISSMKKSAMDRLKLNQYITNCSSKFSTPHQLESVVSCIQKARRDSIEGVCAAQETCMNKAVIRKCLQSYESVKLAACSCLEREQKLNIETDIEGTRDLLNLFLKGQLIKEFKRCSEAHGYNAPKDQMSQANRAIATLSREQLNNGTPVSRGLLQLSAQLIGLITKEILTAWCADCSPIAIRKALKAEITDLTDLKRPKADPKDSNKSLSAFDALGGGIQSLWSFLG